MQPIGLDLFSEVAGCGHDPTGRGELHVFRRSLEQAEIRGRARVRRNPERKLIAKLPCDRRATPRALAAAIPDLTRSRMKYLQYLMESPQSLNEGLRCPRR